jgi:hypothetical protein
LWPVTSQDGPFETLTNTGYDTLEVPEAVVKAAEAYDCPTPAMVLSADELDGRESIPATPGAVTALDWVWSNVTLASMDAGTPRPPIRCFRKVMDGGKLAQGFV